MIKKLILWILVVSCMGTIFFFSGQEAKDSDSSSIGFITVFVRLFDVCDVFSETEIQEFSQSLNGIVRTGAHFTIYAVLGFLLCLLFHEYNFSRSKAIIFAVISSFLYACSDEFHQSFVPGRSAQISDIAVDTSGALCGAVLALFILILIKKLTSRKIVSGKLC